MLFHTICLIQSTDMLLTEYEAKQLLEAEGVEIPPSFLIAVTESSATIAQQLQEIFPQLDFSTHSYFIKAQVLHGNRAPQGLVVSASVHNLEQQVHEMFQKKDQFGQPVTSLIIEQASTISQSLYLAFRYDTSLRQLVLLYSEEGGSGMDDRGDSLQVIPVSSQELPATFSPNEALLPIVQKLWKVFTTNDASLVEINPVALTPTGTYVCLDAKIELEDVAEYRHPEWEAYPKRSAFGRPPSKLEKEALAVSRSDHRGVAGESFFEIDTKGSQNKIGVMASGGGASTLAMDALIAAGVTPANYTEYSGNPVREKVAKLTKVVLSITDLKGLYVVGSNANFTDIYETLAGVIDGFLESSYTNLDTPFVILIRRGGPRWEEAFEMVHERLVSLVESNKVLLKLCGPDYPLLQTAEDMKTLLETARNS